MTREQLIRLIAQRVDAVANTGLDSSPRHAAEDIVRELMDELQVISPSRLREMGWPYGDDDLDEFNTTRRGILGR